MKKLIIPVIAIAMATSAVSYYGISKIQDHKDDFSVQKDGGIIRYASNQNYEVGQPVDFTEAAERAVASTVHITTLVEGRNVQAPSNDPFSAFFGQQQYRIPDQMGSGSGVIISPDGYIVTNNHVVKDANKVKVTFTNRVSKMATVVGIDPATDLAVIKVEGEQLPVATFGNSDGIKLGQWVLAVGYPLNLDATVTSGIISAKSRSLGINRRNSDVAIESFIQTDAAVNPGNSGGALVNAQGQLIGITSAIATPTGAYAGYSYAIPSNLVRKVSKDIIQYGEVKRGYLGAQLIDLNQLTQAQAGEIGISKADFLNQSGVYLSDVQQGSGAAEAGLRKGDFISSVNDVPVKSVAELQEQIANYSPGDVVSLQYSRDGTHKTAKVGLKPLNKIVASGNNSVAGSNSIAALGASFKPISAEQAKSLKVKGGVVITDIDPNGYMAQLSQIRKGFVILMANDQPVASVDDVKAALNTSGAVSLEGIYPGRSGTYSYTFMNRQR